RGRQPSSRRATPRRPSSSSRARRPLPRTRRAERRATRAERGASTAARLVQLGVDLPGCLSRDAGHALQLLRRGLEEPLRRAEVPEQRAAAHGADPLQLVEDRAERPRLASLPVEAEREAVRLIADP